MQSRRQFILALKIGILLSAAAGSWRYVRKLDALLVWMYVPLGSGKYLNERRQRGYCLGSIHYLFLLPDNIYCM